MELKDEQQARHSSGIQNNYYGGVTNVINLRLSSDQRLVIKNGQIFVQNEFSGEIQKLNVAHADVAVGVAEAGANVYHHKTNDNGRK